MLLYQIQAYTGKKVTLVRSCLLPHVLICLRLTRGRLHCFDPKQLLRCSEFDAISLQSSSLLNTYEFFSEGVSAPYSPSPPSSVKILKK